MFKTTLKALTAVILVAMFVHWIDQSGEAAKQQKLVEFEQASATLPESTKHCLEKADHDYSELYNNTNAYLWAWGARRDRDTMQMLIGTRMEPIHQQCRPNVSDTIINAYLDGMQLKREARR